MKKVFIVVLVLLALVYGASLAPICNEAELPRFEPLGTYDLAGIKNNYVTYSFWQPNSYLVVYCIEGTYVLLERGSVQDNCYAIIYMDGHEFLGISGKYWLFRNKKGEKVVVPLNSTAQLGLAISCGEDAAFPYDELPEDEKIGFVKRSRTELVWVGK